MDRPDALGISSEALRDRSAKKTLRARRQPNWPAFRCDWLADGFRVVQENPPSFLVLLEADMTAARSASIAFEGQRRTPPISWDSCSWLRWRGPRFASTSCITRLIQEEAVSTLTVPFARQHRIGPLFGSSTSARRYLAPLGRLLFALIFILSAPHLISGAAVGAAHQHGVPLPSLAVPVAGVIALIGGLSVALGYHGRIGAGLLVLFLVPVTLYMHAFWAEGSPAAAQMQQIEFLKNLALVGAALFVACVGPGPVSFDERLRIR